MLRKILALSLALILSADTFVLPVAAVQTDGTAANWTRAKAEHLARKTLFGPTPATIDALYTAGSSTAAVNILFPDAIGPSRTTFDAEMSALTATGFNYGDGGSMARYYQYRYARDPYEAKAKLSALFEDIFAVNVNGTTITYSDIKNQHDILYSETLGNYKTMVKKILYGTSGSYAEGKFLDLLDQTDKRYPNENYARELLQLFLMGEYEPGKSKENGDVRNYEETDVAAFAKVLTGFRSDSVTHVVSYDRNYHNTSTGVLFLSGGNAVSFPFYNSASGTLDLSTMDASIMGNNGLADNAVDFVFAKRDRQIAYFLADRIWRFYVHDTPTRSELDPLVNTILANNFDMLPTVKTFLASGALYSDASMNAIMYKNPLELTIGATKLLHAMSLSAIDPMLRDTGLLSRLNWTTYIPGSVFGRDGYDKNAKWYSTYIENQWISYANTIAYTSSAGSYTPSDLFGQTRITATGTLFVNNAVAKTLTGHVELGSGTVLLVGATGSLSYPSPSFQIPDISASFATGGISIGSGTIDFTTMQVTVSSGSYTATGVTYPIASAQFTLLPTSSITRSINADEITSALETSLLLGRRLPDQVRSRIATFLTVSETGATLVPNFSDANYVSKKIRGAVAIILTQPEFVLQTGHDQPSDTATSGSTPISGSNSKLLLVELPGGYDWLHGIIQKDEYNNYVSKRTTNSGTMAIDLARLTDLGDFYMNNAIAYGSGGSASFKSLYDSNNLRIFNRVGTPKHSRDHDAAQKQIASYGDTTFADADGVFGQLVKNHSEDMDTVSLTGRRPNVFRNGRYVNIGPSGAIFSHPRGASSAEGIQELTAVRTILNERSYPGAIAGLFQWAVKIDQVASRSQSSGGPSGAGYGNTNNLAFLRTLLANNTGKTFYMQADGWYDTHSAQLAPQSNFDPNNVPKDLNYNIGRVAENLTKFFNDVKSTQDITIVVFSEFGRTIATNGDLGTDHGQAGGMFVLSNNANFLSSVPNKFVGNLSFKNAKDNWLGVGVDYRSVYGNIYNALYGVSATDHFGKTVRLTDNTSVTAPRFTFTQNNFRMNGASTTSAILSVPFRIEDRNFDTNYASYVTIEYGTGVNSLRRLSQYTVDNSLRLPDGSYRFNAGALTSGSNYIYRITAYNNQYITSVLTGSLTVPSIIPTTGSGANTISRTGDSVLRGYSNVSVTGSTALSGTGIIIANNGTGSTLRIPARNGITIEAGTGLTTITRLTSSSGTLSWSGGFILGETVDANSFVATGATIVGSGMLPPERIAKMIRIGADTVGVGMRLNKSLSIELTGLSGSTLYQLVSSEDGINWSPMGSGSVTTDSSGKARFDTDHFTYFAFVIPEVVTTPTTPNTPSSGGGGGGGGGWGGGGGYYVQDTCPGGDYSGSYYDNSCGTPQKTSGSGTTGTVPSRTTGAPSGGILSTPAIRSYDFSQGTRLPQSVASDLNFAIKKITTVIDTKAGKDGTKQARYYRAVDVYFANALAKYPDIRSQRIFSYLRTRLRVVAGDILTRPIATSTVVSTTQTATPPTTTPLRKTPSTSVVQTGAPTKTWSTTPITTQSSTLPPIDLNSSAFDGYDGSKPRLPSKVSDAVSQIANNIISQLNTNYPSATLRKQAYTKVITELDDRIMKAVSEKERKILKALRDKIYREIR